MIYQKTVKGGITQAAATRNSTVLLDGGVKNLIHSEGWFEEDEMGENRLSIGHLHFANNPPTTFVGYSFVIKNNTNKNVTLFSYFNTVRTNKPYEVTLFYTKI